MVVAGSRTPDPTVGAEMIRACLLVCERVELPITVVPSFADGITLLGLDADTKRAAVAV